MKTLTVERAREFAEAANRKERRLNDDFIRKLVAKVRRLTREACQQGISALMLVEPIRSYSLRGARIQGTLQRGETSPEEPGYLRGHCVQGARVKPLTPCLTSV